MVVEAALDLLALVASGFGTLTLAALGLVVIYGMMGIINFAHGEFIMVGAYVTVLSYHAGVPLAPAILLGGLGAGMLGAVLERVLIRHLYDREIDSMVATWAVSIIISQTVFVIFGQSVSGIKTPLGAVTYGGFSASAYDFVLAGAALVLLLVTYWVFMYTTYGLHARATMQDEVTARSMGVDTKRMYRDTFAYGCVLAGIAGGLFAPTLAIVPNLGQQFIIDAFVTVIVGGANVLVGTPLSALALSFIDGFASQWGGALVGRVALLATAIVIIRVLPEGISSYWEEHAR